ncbi:MAG TPA: AtpZ/AtpI family protein [Candidatus Baltobacteraceae bacterium]|nr:AtpZ/AtpI family protein [Candidatus Baltobacteraceae bacterium]
MPDDKPTLIGQLARLSTVGLTLVASTAIGLLFGYLLDRWLGTTPWLTMLCTLFGIAGGFLNLFRELGILKRP